MKKLISINKYVETPSIRLNKKCMDVYTEVVARIMMRSRKSPVTANALISRIRTIFGVVITDSEIRRIVLHARIIDKEPIGSSQSGYFKASTYDDYLTTASHFYSRIDKMLFGLITLREHFRTDNEPNLFGD